VLSGGGAERTGGLARRGVIAFDRWLRRRQGIFEFSTHPGCILLAGLKPAAADIALPDGTRILRGQPILDLHLWNERAPPLPADGPAFEWLAAFDSAFRLSLAQLASHLDRHPELAKVQALRIETAFGRPDGDMERVGRRYGFAAVRRPEAPSLGRRIHWFFAGFLFLALTWAYNPASLKGKRFRRQQDEFWMSRAALERRHGAASRARSLIA
jgi:hypothetical protein